MALGLPEGTKKNDVLKLLWDLSGARAAKVSRRPLSLSMKQILLDGALVRLNSGTATQREMAGILCLKATIEGLPAIGTTGGRNRFPFLTGIQRSIEAHRAECAARR